MDAQKQVTVQLRVVSGAEFPRTNFIGTIDPYIRVYLDGNVLGETRHFKNQQDPVWEEDFFFDAGRDEDGCLCCILRLELYNENRARQDEHVGSVEIDLSELPPKAFDPIVKQKAQFYEYDIVYKDEKRGEKFSRQGRSPTLTVGFLGSIPSWSALVAQLAGWEEMGILVDEDSSQLYVPLPGGEGAGLYGGIQYLLPRAVHFKLVTASKHHAGLHLDFRCSKARCLRVERVSYHKQRKRLLKGLRVFAEATLTNLPLFTDLGKLQLLASKRRAAASHSVPDTLERAGFPTDATGSSLSYKRVSRAMAAPSGALLDAHSSCVYVPVRSQASPAAMLQLDFGEGSGDGGRLGRSGGRREGGSQRAVLRALTMKADRSEGQGREFVYDFLTASCETTTTITESYRRGIKILGGEYQYTCTAELPGTFDDQRLEVYDSAALVAFSLEAEPITSCRFSELFEPPPEPEADEDGNALLAALDPDLIPHSMGSMAIMVAQQGGKMVGKVVDQLGNLVGGMSLGGSGGNSTPNPGGAGGGALVLKAIKAPLKLLRAGKDVVVGKQAALDHEESSALGTEEQGRRGETGRGERSNGCGRDTRMSGDLSNGSGGDGGLGKEQGSEGHGSGRYKSNTTGKDRSRNGEGGRNGGREGAITGSRKKRELLMNSGSGGGGNRGGGSGSGGAQIRSRRGALWDEDHDDDDDDDSD
ncbi:hypothetical protein VaNZ11_014109 [Volvox africanus]|uniref:C2 domain-containing protein n=1 Tax=Volvox africanus TaxID=51714 RepID=A0ABQ5SHQ5_9CHLO|nr:hypothetical protein VaNZ11_014109 [Volvox africanus]